MISQLFVLFLTLITTFAKEENCKDGKNNSNDNFMVLVLILGTIYLLNHHKVGQRVHEEEEEVSSDEDESDDDEDEEQEESENSAASEMEDESDDDDDGDNGVSSEEERDEEEEEIESDAESTKRTRRSSRLGGKSMGHAAQE